MTHVWIGLFIVQCSLERDSIQNVRALIVSLLLRLAWKTVLIKRAGTSWIGDARCYWIHCLSVSIENPYLIYSTISGRIVYLNKTTCFLVSLFLSFITAVTCTIITLILDILLFHEMGHRIMYDCHTNEPSRQSSQCLQYLVLWLHFANGLGAFGIWRKWDVSVSFDPTVKDLRD